MKKHKKILIILFIIIIFNFGYFLFAKWQDYSSEKNSLTAHKAELKTYSSPKMNFEVKYPDSWIVKESVDKIDINPPSEVPSSYFTAALRQEFKSLDDIKRTLAPSVVTTPVQISDSSGFEYTDSDFHKITWLFHSGKVYMIRTYPRALEANHILASLKFTN